MDTTCFILLTTVTAATAANQYLYHHGLSTQSGYPRNAHNHEFDFRRFGGYPVHIGNGRFRFLNIHGDPNYPQSHESATAEAVIKTAVPEVSRKDARMAFSLREVINPIPSQEKIPEGPNKESSPSLTPQRKGFLPPQVKIEDLPYTKTIISPGDGVHFPARGDTVKVWYTGMLVNGRKFDSNLPSTAGDEARSAPAEPLSFPVGTGLVIRGWDEVLPTMSVGERARVTIQPRWGYGEEGAGPIPPNAVLIFDMQLAGIQ